MRQWMRNVKVAIKTVGQGMWITLWYFFQTYHRKAFTQEFEYPELPVPVKPRYRGFHRFDLTTCIGCDKCARACPVDCIYIEKVKNPVGKGFRVNGFKIDYTKCMFCALCVDPCPVDCIFMGSTHDQSCYSRDGCIGDFAMLPPHFREGGRGKMAGKTPARGKKYFTVAQANATLPLIRAIVRDITVLA